MKVIGVTGGIGSGKSTVSRYLAKMGAEVIDADQIAREITDKGQEALEELKGHFGGSILNPDGSLNRKALGDIAFCSPKELAALNGITHKHIADVIIKRLDNIISSNNVKFAVIDAPIPLPHGFLDTAGEIWVIAADRELRARRVMARSGFTYDEALRRMDSQMNDEDYFKIADHILWNNGSEEDLNRQIEKILFTGDYFGDKKTE